MIRVEELRAGYRAGFRRAWREVLQGVSFHVPRGAIAGYLGVNGAGKTTTIKVLVGVNAPTGGRASIAGHPVGTPAAQRALGYAQEAPFFYEGLTARELLGFYARLSGVPRPERAPRAEALLEEVQLSDAGDRPVRGFSKGMRQRLALAQALVHDPELLVLDEPLDGLDSMGRLHLRELIARQRDRGRTVFFSSHVLSDVEAVCDHLVVLDGAKVAYEGPTAGFMAQGDLTIEVRLAGALTADATAALAAAAGDPPATSGEVHVVRCATQAQADAVVDAARAAGLQVVALTPARHSLEERFLEAFGRPRQAAGGAA
ncbi:MAG: ABC transporter ATP-binding protein [Planctomycetes bacterium]|nr:ABC transporter ATP-binding protein [Planctomycetota bacterium]